MTARFGFWLIIVLLLIFLFIFYRKRFNQVVLILGLSMVVEVLVRLTHLTGADQSGLEWEAVFLAGIAALYGIVWLGGKYRGTGAGPPPPRPQRKGSPTSRHR